MKHIVDLSGCIDSGIREMSEHEVQCLPPESTRYKGDISLIIDVHALNDLQK